MVNKKTLAGGIIILLICAVPKNMAYSGLWTKALRGHFIYVQTMNF